MPEHRYATHARPASKAAACRPAGRSTGPTAAPERPADELLDLQRSAGNRAVAGLFAEPRAAGQMIRYPALRIQRQRDRRSNVLGSKSRAPKKGRRDTARKGEPKGSSAAPAGPGPSADLLLATEAWIRYIALRGNDTRPSKPVPAAYRGAIIVIQSAIGGPGPIAPAELEIDRLMFGDARAMLVRLRADHARLLPKVDTGVYDLADLGVDRGLANFTNAPDAWGEGGATEYDQAETFFIIWNAAESEIKASTEQGYTIPKGLTELAQDARRQFEQAKAGWARGSPSQTKLTMPSEELDLIQFSDDALDVINDMRSRRLADMRRAHEAEEEALRQKAEKDLVELRAILADRRRAAFRAGDKDALEKVQEALNQVVSAIDDTKEAAGLITERVDQINAAAQMFSKSGKKLIELPKLPKGLTDVADKLKKANSKLKKVIELLDLVGPSKTELDEGLKYLKGADMAMSHFAGKSANPFLAVYVNSYLSPGIKNCIAGISKIADLISKQNRGLIEQGMPQYVNWKVEMGGEAMYLFVSGVFRTKGATPISDAAWDFIRDHRGDLEAAVGGEKMPRERRAVPAWAAKHRIKLWEAFYGSTRPPYE